MITKTRTKKGRPVTTTSPDETALDPRSPRARLTALFDEGTLDTITADDDSGVLVGVGRMLGTAAVAFACDPTIQGGAMGIAGCTAIVTAYDRALLDGVPIVGLWHSGGARLREGVESLDGVGRVFAAMTRASGKVLRSRSCSDLPRVERPTVLHSPTS